MLSGESIDYKHIRDTAWKVLLDNHIAALPVDIFALCERYGIRIADSEMASGFFSAVGFDARKIRMNTVVFCPADRIVAVCDKRLAYEDRRMGAAVVLGHLLLGHISDREAERPLVVVFSDLQISQAYQFAVRVLMPLCVLRAIGTDSSAEIACICQVPSEEAAKRLIRLRFIEYRNQRTGERTGQGVFNISQYEKRLRHAFSAYINSYTYSKDEKRSI